MDPSSSSLRHTHIPIFTGQGNPAVNTIQTQQQAIRASESPSGSLLLSSCHHIFLEELSSLSTEEAAHVKLSASDFSTPNSLLTVPSPQHSNNAVISGTRLFLIQSLLYLYFESASDSSASLSHSFGASLHSNSEFRAGILGFSSGILPATVVATSSSTIDYIYRSVQAFRLAFWIGVRAHIYRSSTLTNSIQRALPWSLSFSGLNKDHVQNAIDDFGRGEDDHAGSLFVTAVITEDYVTVSGHPETLAAFSQVISGQCNVHRTCCDTLYHCPSHSTGVREQILSDVSRRNLAFPTFADLKLPLRSTFSGEIISQESAGPATLLELIVDMIVVQPVRWDAIVSELSKSPVSHRPVHLLAVGPGTSLANVTRKALAGDVSIIDINKHAEESATQEPIAIVGMSLNMPGAPEASQLWRILEDGINTVSQVPEGRFRVSEYNEACGKASRSMKASTGNFISNIEDFDHKFFSISPREAKSMDPQQRLLLHCAHHALEDSGYVPNATPSFDPETFACYVGAATEDYVQNLRDEIDVYYSTGTLKAFMSGRISHAMQWGGPSVVTDTACSSSLVAIYQGCRALVNRDCNAALVGGVNAITSPDMFIGLDKGHFLSPTGQCKSFDESADGYSRSEGVGLFVIKRLSDALAENDRILGVIRGIEVNQSGLSSSITRPHAPTQADLFRRVLRASGLPASRVNVVESHGTGTQAGDPSELESIRSIFAARRPASNPLHVTSIKANIGHLEAASGAAGLAKLLLMLKHRTIPQQISLKKLNPNIAPLESDGTIIDTVNSPWDASHDGMTRVALLNNFGAAGSNAAMLLEEAPQRETPFEVSEATHHVFAISAKSQIALETLMSRYDTWLRNPESSTIALSDIAYTATARRQIYQYRVAFSFADRGELIHKLNAAEATQSYGRPSGAVFVFSGQGGQYPGMGRSLYRSSPVFRKHIDECHSFLQNAGFSGILHIIDAEESGTADFDDLEGYQAAILSLEYALAKLWLTWGVLPTAVVGHSLGEYAALVLAQVLTIEDALLIVANRARFMAKSCVFGATGMIAINTNADKVESILGGSIAFTELSIACYNSGSDCVVSGPLERLRELKVALDGVARSKILAVPFGFHSAAMDPVLEDLTRVATKVKLSAPTIPIVSNVLGEVVLPGDSSVFTPSYFARHCAEPVLFDSGIRALVGQSSGAAGDIWIEIGPQPTSLPMLKANDFISTNSLLLPSLKKGQSGWQTLTETLSRLYTLGLPVAWRHVFDHVTCQCVDVPAYPFASTTHWVPFTEPSRNDAPAPSSSKALDFSLLTTWIQHPSTSNGQTSVFESPIGNLVQYILGHTVGGSALCPASVYVELGLAGVQLTNRHLGIALDKDHAVLRDVKFVNPLVASDDRSRIVRTTIAQSERSGTISVSSQSSSTTEESIHMTCEYTLQGIAHSDLKFSRLAPLLGRWMSPFTESGRSSSLETFSKRTAYNVIFPRIVTYSKEYHTMQSIAIDESGMEGHALVEFPSDHHRGNFLIHPVFTDTLLHVAGFVANLQGGVNDAYICTNVGSSRINANLVDHNGKYSVFCRLVWLAAEGVMLADSFAVQRSEPHQVVARMKGISFRRVRLDGLQRSLALASKASGASSPRSQTAAIKHEARQTMHAVVRSTRRSIEDTVETTVLSVFSNACDIPTTSLDVGAPLDAIGVDSLMIIDVVGRLQSEFPEAGLRAHELSACRTIDDVTSEILSRVASGSDTPSSTVDSDTSSIATCSTATADIDDARKVLAQSLGVGLPEIVNTSNFQDLGLDSLSSIETLHALNDHYGIALPQDIFSNCVDLPSLEAYISSSLVRSSKPVKKEPELMVNPRHRSLEHAFHLDTLPRPIKSSPTSTNYPLFVVHDGSGLVDYYDRLSDIERDIWGIHNPNFLSEQQWKSVSDMATAYSSLVMSVTKGPLLLGGWSFGGVVAYEIAKQLRAAGVEVKGLLLIDSPSPMNHVPLPTALLDRIAGLDARIQAGSEVHRLMKTQFEFNTQILGRYNPQADERVVQPKIALLRSREGFNPCDLPPGAVIPRWLADRSNPKQVVEGWEQLVGQPVRVWDIPGHHFQPFDPSNVSTLSRSIKAACNFLES